jgi:DNA polymerase-3 subunit beta
MQFSVKLVDAQFPPYQQVIPQSTSRSVIRAPRSAFARRPARRLSRGQRPHRRREARLGPWRPAHHEREPGERQRLRRAPVDYDGPEITIGFNAKYFLDVLGAIKDEDEVVLGLSGELDPAVLRPGKDSDKEGYVAVVMPMRI